MKRKLIVANWKMNPATPAEAKRIFLETKKNAQKLKKVDTVICPPALYAGLFSDGHPLRGRVTLGAQDGFFEKSGAYTGEISFAMLKAAGVSCVIVGHSERRGRGEDDGTVNKKVKAALKEKLTTILCVGEHTRDESAAYLGFIREQLKAALAGVTAKEAERLVVAYEPVWAIGAKAAKADSPKDTLEIVLFIRKILVELFDKTAAFKTRVLYGGSVDKDNALPFFISGGVDGFLVGRASVNPKEFRGILESGETAPQ